VNDFSVEVSNANVLIEDDRLHRALNHVNEAAVMAIRVAEDVHDAVVDGRTPKADSIRTVQRIMHTRAAEARSLAWELLRSGLDETRAATD
jgi:predicted subunit of tRNA(5-methylaminomethyl-2-thiouridylate) methyltransferase